MFCPLCKPSEVGSNRASGLSIKTLADMLFLVTADSNYIVNHYFQVFFRGPETGQCNYCACGWKLNAVMHPICVDLRPAAHHGTAPTRFGETSWNGPRAVHHVEGPCARGLQ